MSPPGNFEPAVRAMDSQILSGQPLQARTVLQSRGPSDFRRLGQSMHCGTATRLEVRLAPKLIRRIVYGD